MFDKERSVTLHPINIYVAWPLTIEKKGYASYDIEELRRIIDDENKVSINIIGDDLGDCYDCVRDDTDSSGYGGVHGG